MTAWRSEVAASLRKAAADLRATPVFKPKAKPVPAQRKLLGPNQLAKMSVADIAEMVIRQMQLAKFNHPMAKQADMLGLTPQGWKMLTLELSQLPEIKTVVNDWLGLEPSEPADEDEAYARMAMGAALKASAEGEAWVRDRITKMNPIREGMDEAFYNSKVDEFMSTAKTKELIRDVGEALRGKPIAVAAFRRAMTPGSSWRSTGLAPKKDMGTRQVKTVRSNDIVFSKEDGSDTHLDLPEAEVRQLGDTFFVFWPDTMNVLKYEPASFDSTAAQQAKEERARAQQEAEALRQQKEKAAQDAAQAAEAALWDGFLVGLPNLKKGQAKKSLDKLIRMNDRTAKTGDHIRDMVAKGYRVDGDRFWDADRRSFFDKKVLGALPFMYAVFLAEKVRSGSAQKPPWRCAACKGPVQHDQTDAVSFCPACKEYVNVERKPPKKVASTLRASAGFKLSAAMSDSEFWDTIASIGWDGKSQDWDKIKKKILTTLSPDQIESLNDAFRKAKGALSKAIEKWEKHDEIDAEDEGREPRTMGLGDDSFGDLLSHIVGLGKKEYDAVMADPELAYERARKHKFLESFGYAIPFKSDIENLSPKKYIAWAQRLVDDGYPLEPEDKHGYGMEGPKPPESSTGKKAMMLVQKALKLLAEGDVASFLALEQEVVPAAEALSKEIHSNKWAVLNLYSDMKKYLDA